MRASAKIGLVACHADCIDTLWGGRGQRLYVAMFLFKNVECRRPAAGDRSLVMIQNLFLLTFVLLTSPLWANDEEQLIIYI